MKSVNRNGVRGFRRNTPAESSRLTGLKRHRSRLLTMEQTNGTQPDGAQAIETQVSTQTNGIVLPECQPGTSTGTWTCQTPTKPKTKSSTGSKTKSSAGSKTKTGQKSLPRPKTKRGRKSRRSYRVESDTDSISEPEDKFFIQDYDKYLIEFDEESSGTNSEPEDPFFVMDYEDFLKDDEERSNSGSEYTLNKSPRHGVPAKVDSGSETETDLDFGSPCSSVDGPDDVTVVNSFNKEDLPIDSDDCDPVDVSVRRWLNNAGH